MKRGGRLQRKTELRNTTPLESRSELKRTAPLPRQRLPLSGSGLSQKARQQPKRTPWKPTRQRVSREEVEARRTVRQRSGGVCEICQAQPATNFQHRLPKSGQGAWTASNGIDVCGNGNVSGCHGAIHQRPEQAYRMGWSVRRGQDPAAVPVWLGGGREWVLLDDAGGMTPINEIPDEEAQ